MIVHESNNAPKRHKAMTSSIDLRRRVLISVVICTYNRVDFLTDALQSVCVQSLERADYEVIVVDNNSTDDTANVCHSFAARYPAIRYTFEPKQGLSHARNRGWQEARGDYVAYIDDDCKVPGEWLGVAKTIIEELAPGVFGGPFFAYYSTPKPAWFKDEYGSHIPYPQATPIEGTQGGLYGGNIFIARSLIERVKGFNPHLGMVGNKMAYGEESALVRAIYAMQPETLLYYDPRLWVEHAVRPEKMNIVWLMRQRFINARYMERVAQQAQSQIGRVGLLLRMVKTGCHFILSVTFKALLWERAKFPYVQNYLYEDASEHLSRLGLLYEQYAQVASQKNRGSNRGQSDGTKSDGNIRVKHENQN